MWPHPYESGWVRRRFAMVSLTAKERNAMAIDTFIAFVAVYADAEGAEADYDA